MAKNDDEIIVPKRPKTKPPSGGRSSGSSPSAPMRRIMRITCGVGVVLGGFVTLVGFMSVVGLVTDNVWVRVVLGLLVVVGLPALLADRVLKHSSANLATRGSLGMVADLFAIILLGVALTLIAANSVTSGIFTREGDRYARSGSTTMARMVYFIAGVTPVFPADKAGAPPHGSASGSTSGALPASSAAPPPSR